MFFKKLLIALFVTALGFVSLPVTTVKAEAAQVPTLVEFTSSLNSTAGLAGVYAEDALALPVVQQPGGNAGFVSSQPGVATEFALAAQYNTTGLLAHNTLAGADFSLLTLGQEIVLVYANGEQKAFRVTAVESYQALSPLSPYSDFLSLADANARLTATDLFNHVYAPGNRVVLQTCIERNGDASWGRLFVIAEPVTTKALPIVTYQPIAASYSTSLAVAH